MGRWAVWDGGQGWGMSACGSLSSAAAHIANHHQHQRTPYQYHSPAYCSGTPPPHASAASAAASIISTVLHLLHHRPDHVYDDASTALPPRRHHLRAPPYRIQHGADQGAWGHTSTPTLTPALWVGSGGCACAWGHGLDVTAMTPGHTGKPSMTLQGPHVPSPCHPTRVASATT